MHNKRGKCRLQKHGRFDRDGSCGLARTFAETGPEFPREMMPPRKKSMSSKQINSDGQRKPNRNRLADEEVKFYLRELEEIDEKEETNVAERAWAWTKTADDVPTEDMAKAQPALDSTSGENSLDGTKTGFWQSGGGGTCDSGAESQEEDLVSDSGESTSSNGGNSDFTAETATGSGSGSGTDFGGNENGSNEMARSALATVGYNTSLDNLINLGRELTTDFELHMNDMQLGIARLMELSLDVDRLEAALHIPEFQ